MIDEHLLVFCLWVVSSEATNCLFIVENLPLPCSVIGLVGSACVTMRDPIQVHMVTVFSLVTVFAKTTVGVVSPN